MTLEEAINRYERQTEELYNAIPCGGCAFNTCKKEHRQLAEWLRELQRWRAFGDKITPIILDYLGEDEVKRLLEEQNTEKHTCADCLLDNTDSCSRGAGRAVDDEICEDFI